MLILILCAESVYIGKPDSKKRRIQIKQRFTMSEGVHLVMFSPDVTELVATDTIGNLSVYNLHQVNTCLLINTVTKSRREHLISFPSWSKS
jgi:hypothetical protein